MLRRRVLLHTQLTFPVLKDKNPPSPRKINPNERTESMAVRTASRRPTTTDADATDSTVAIAVRSGGRILWAVRWAADPPRPPPPRHPLSLPRPVSIGKQNTYQDEDEDSAADLVPFRKVKVISAECSEEEMKVKDAVEREKVLQKIAEEGRESQAFRSHETKFRKQDSYLLRRPWIDTKQR